MFICCYCINHHRHNYVLNVTICLPTSVCNNCIFLSPHAETGCVVLFWMTDALDTEMKDETEEPVDLVPTLIPLPPDEVYISTVL